MTKDELIRAAMHFPIGVIIVLIMAFVPPLPLGLTIGILLAVSFLAYEFIQEWRKHDLSYKDVIGIIPGLIAGALIVYFGR